MNIGDNPAVIVVTACDPCTKQGAKIPTDAFRSVLVEPEGDADAIPLMVNVAAPGMGMWGLARRLDGYSKASGPSTSHATAYVAGVVRGMLSCYWDHYRDDDDQNIKGDLKQRLMLTSWPGHLNFDKDLKGKSVTVGIVDPEAAWLDPTLTWIRTADLENGCFRPAGAILLGHSCNDVRELNGPQLRVAYGGSDAEGWCADEIPFSSGEPRDPRNILRLAVWPSTNGTKRYFSVSSIYPKRRRDSAAQQWLGLRAGHLNPKRLGDEAPLLKISGIDVNGEPTSKLLRLADVSDVILSSLKGKISCK